MYIFVYITCLFLDSLPSNAPRKTRVPPNGMKAWEKTPSTDIR